MSTDVKNEFIILTKLRNILEWKHMKSLIFSLFSFIFLTGFLSKKPVVKAIFDSEQIGKYFWEAEVIKEIGPNTIVFKNKNKEEVFSYQFKNGDINEFYLFKNKKKSFLVGAWYIGNRSNLVQAIDPVEKKVYKITYCASESSIEIGADKVSVICEKKEDSNLSITNWSK